MSNLLDNHTALDTLLSMVEALPSGGGLPSGEFTPVADTSTASFEVGEDAIGVVVWTADASMLNRKSLCSACVWTPYKGNNMTTSGASVGTNAYNAYVSSATITGANDNGTITLTLGGSSAHGGQFGSGMTYKWRAI